MRTHLLRCWLCSSFERLDEADPEWHHRLLGMSPLTAELVCYLLTDSRCADGLSVHNRSTLQTLEELPQGVTASLSTVVFDTGLSPLVRLQTLSCSRYVTSPSGVS